VVDKAKRRIVLLLGQGASASLIAQLEKQMDLSLYFTADFLLSFITMTNVLGAIGGLLYIASISMKTVIHCVSPPLPVRCLLFSGIFARSFPSIFLYSLLLPLNSFRLYQMLELIKKVRAAAATSDLSMDWLEPFMQTRKYRKGDILFRKGDVADEMLLAVKGKYLVSELNIELQPGHIFGEMGLLTSDLRRTQSVECIETGYVRTISYDKVRELYFENPEFGFYFLRLTSDRLLQDWRRAEEMLVKERQKRLALEAELSR
jgi:CRP-like cAMP-binding protein